MYASRSPLELRNLHHRSGESRQPRSQTPPGAPPVVPVSRHIPLGLLARLLPLRAEALVSLMADNRYA